MAAPKKPISLMKQVYKKIFPVVHEELSYWKKRAEEIPDPELRNQALASIKTKTFHCEGGSILALCAGDKYKEAIRFIVSYQTISDYLDNLCDRSTSLDPKDFAALHESMEIALTVGKNHTNYYRHRNEREDGGYLRELAETCQNVLRTVPHYEKIKKHLLELCRYYCDLQIHKHVTVHERVPRLKNWFNQYKHKLPRMEWYEFSACSGSTLGIFCLVSYGMRNDFAEETAENIRNGYFPYVQGLHILLDYFIDQEEDRAGGDLNFCFYYHDEKALFDRLSHFIQEADRHIEKLPDSHFHKLINRGLLGLYLSDEKVQQQKPVKILAKEIIKKSGLTSFFFYLNGIIYRKLQKRTLQTE